MGKARMLNLLLLVVSAVILFLTASSFLKIVSTIAPDFTVFYGAGQNLVQGKNIYQDNSFFTAFNYPPQTAVLYLPFLLFPYGVAQGVFTFLNFCLVPLSVLLSLRLVKEDFSWQRLLLLTNLAFLAFPVKFTLGMGQSNLLALFLFLVSFFFYQQKRSTAAGIILGLAIIAKPVLLFVGLLYLFRRQWKILIISVVTILLFTLIPLIFHGASLYGYYFTTQLPEITKQSGLAVYYNQSLLGTLNRLTQNVMLAQILYYAGFIGILWGTLRTLLSKERNDVILLNRLFIALLLLNVISWQHHFAFLLFPFIVLGLRLRESAQSAKQLVFLLAFFLVSINLKNPAVFINFPQSILLSHAFFGALLLWLFFVPLSEKKKY